MTPSENTQILTTNLILNRLQERVSKGNAKLLLDTAKIRSGLAFVDSDELQKEDAKTLCLVMIKQGGPAFQVAQSIYKEYLM